MSHKARMEADMIEGLENPIILCVQIPNSVNTSTVSTLQNLNTVFHCKESITHTLNRKETSNE